MAARSSSNEIRVVRVYDAPVRAVWDAWTVLEQVEKWWGPRGFTITTHSKDLRPGGTWRYTMHGPDGVDYPNIATYLVVEPLKKLVYDHGATEHTPPLFRVTVTFTETSGKTTMEMISTLPTPEAAAQIAKHIRKAGGYGTWDRLAEHLAERCSGKKLFVINRTFEASIARVFEMWVDPEHLAKWLPPAGTTMRFLRSEIAQGKSTLFTIVGENVSMHVRAEYLAIEPPRLLVYRQQFTDEHERPARAPGAEFFPSALLNTVRFAEEAPGRTRVTLTTEAEGHTTAAELDAFVRERSGMTLGWTGSFDVLEAMIEAAVSS
jgi:uncharacterized protein YndB with AHSA1/START domain